MKDLHDTIDQILSLGPARRGQLSEQYLRGRRKDGTEVLRGPYYVLQWYEGGAKKSARVPRDQVERVKAELELGRQVEALLGDAEEALWKRLSGPAQKKTKAKKISGRSCGRSTRRASSAKTAST